MLFRYLLYKESLFQELEYVYQENKYKNYYEGCKYCDQGERISFQFGETDSIVAEVIDGVPFPEESITWNVFWLESSIGIEFMF